MNRRSFLAAAPAFALVGGLSGCGSEPSVDLYEAMRRTIIAMDYYDRYLKENKIEKAGEKELAEFEGFLNQALNAEPKLHKTALAVKMQSDASFDGFEDVAGDGAVEGDKKLFKIEIDIANNRLIGTDMQGAGTSFGMAGAGFLAGALLGSLLSRQSAAGVRRGSFNNRNLKSPRDYARGRARSGGLFGGK